MATNNSINFTNWNYAHYNSEHFKALISISAEPNGDEVNILYSPTVVDEDGNENFQCDFKDLDKAISFINERYGHWKFNDPTQGSGEGCGSCEAH